MAQPGLVGDDGAVIDVAREQFEDLVGEALDSIPDELARLMDNVVVLVEDLSPRGQRLLGLYYGVPLTERGTNYAGMLPDTITIYRIPILRMCATAEEVVTQVRITVVHEVAHHFGFSDERLHELGAY
jgi:predicted Zn-dependent protease with MMP-like domain